ncbi:MAG: N-formylglutamate amidohydrolase [Alphaproteobacteria bacterium]
MFEPTIRNPSAPSELATDEPATAAPGHPAFEVVPGDVAGGLIILCDHASNHIPKDYHNLGLPPAQLARHIAFDIGVREVTLRLAKALNAPAILSRFSRLLIDPNRDGGDPTLVMKIADGAIVPGNVGVGAGETDRRLEKFHVPYHQAIDQTIDQAMAQGVPPALFSVHSFTPAFKDQHRPWHATVLWDCDPRLPVPLLQALAQPGDIVVGENVPYSGKLQGDTMYRHASQRGLAHALIEIRQDLIGTAEGAAAWADRLTAILKPLKAAPDLRIIKRYI